MYIQFGANIDFPICAYIIISMVLANIVYDTGENYNLASTFSRWNEVDLLLIAPAASPRSCGRCRKGARVIAYSARTTKVRFSLLYAALSNDTRSAILSQPIYDRTSSNYRITRFFLSERISRAAWPVTCRQGCIVYACV